MAKFNACGGHGGIGHGKPMGYIQCPACGGTGETAPAPDALALQAQLARYEAVIAAVRAVAALPGSPDCPCGMCTARREVLAALAELDGGAK